MSKRNQYILFIIVCILAILLIEASITPISNSEVSFPFELNKAKFVLNSAMILLVIFGLLYLNIILIGIIQLAILTVRKIKKKALASIQEKQKPFNLSEEKASQLLFLISACLCFSYIVPTLLYKLQWKLSLDFLISINMLLQITVILLVWKYLKIKNLGLAFDKKYTIFALSTYSAVLPILIVSALVNGFVANKLGFKDSLNPAIELLFLLKNKTSISLLVLQVIALGPLAEELFFRGFIYKLVRSRFNFLGSAMVVSLFFSLLHRTPYSVLPIFILSMALCYLYEKSQNIYPCFLFHSIFNTVNLSFCLLMKEFF
ncbi:MAG: CPBP family intramembrane metalloprotease [Candidatus Omnitrophica bacterium]|nr:CPBP family intramembrane metalloprotease [Candidatus Omnitrophota bacterium]